MAQNKNQTVHSHAGASNKLQEKEKSKKKSQNNNNKKKINPKRNTETHQVNTYFLETCSSIIWKKSFLLLAQYQLSYSLYLVLLAMLKVLMLPSAAILTFWILKSIAESTLYSKIEGQQKAKR